MDFVVTMVFSLVSVLVNVIEPLVLFILVDVQDLEASMPIMQWPLVHTLADA
jgi:hypothetical protein